MAFTDRELLLAGDLKPRAGLRVLNLDGTFIDDVSDDLAAGTSVVSRAHPLRGSAIAEFRCTLRRQLPWTEVLVAPYVTVVDRMTGRERTWEMGVYLPEAPAQTKAAADEYDLEAHDLIEIYDTQITGSFRAAADDNVVEAVKAFVSNEARWPSFDPTFAFGSDSGTFRHEAAWVLTDNVSYLDVVNEMLQRIAWRPLWTTRTGQLATEEGSLLFSRGSQWLIDGTADDGQIGAGSFVDLQSRGTPNVFLGVHYNPSGDVPTDGDGIYRVVNDAGGPLSVPVRGREVNRIVTTDAASQDHLLTHVQSVAEETVAASERIVIETGPLPWIWHLSTVTVNDPALGLHHAPAVVRSWTLPLDGKTMSLECHRLYKLVV